MSCCYWCNICSCCWRNSNWDAVVDECETWEKMGNEVVVVIDGLTCCLILWQRVICFDAFLIMRFLFFRSYRFSWLVDFVLDGCIIIWDAGDQSLELRLSFDVLMFLPLSSFSGQMMAVGSRIKISSGHCVETFHHQGIHCQNNPRCFDSILHLRCTWWCVKIAPLMSNLVDTNNLLIKECCRQ